MGGISSFIMAGLMIVAGAVLTAFGAGAIGVRLMLAGTLTLISAFMGTQSGRSGFRSSPTYGFDSLSNQRSEGAPIPVVYGEHLIAPALISTNLVTEGDKQVYYFLYAVCEGEIESIHSIRINDTPIDAFPDVVAVTDRLGTAAQDAIPGFGQVGQAYDAGTMLQVSGSHTHEMHATADELVIALSWDGGLFHMTDEGKTNSASWVAKIEYKPYGSADTSYKAISPDTGTDKTAGWSLDNAQAGTWKVWGESNATVRKQIRLRFDGASGRPAAGRYTVRITGSGPSDTSLTNTPRVLYFIEVTSDSRTYANTALLALKMPASQQLSGGMPQITCVVKGRKVYDPRDATTAWSQNPVLCARDLILDSRYGLGFYGLTSADLDEGVGGSWRTAADACEATVTPPGASAAEERYQIDYVLDVIGPAADHIQQMLQSARMTLFQADGLLRIAQDKVGTSARAFESRSTAAVANRRNILDRGDGRNSLTVRSLDASSRSTAVRVQYLDRLKGWGKRVIQIRDTRITIGAISGGPFQAGEKIKGTTSQAVGIVTASFANGAAALTYTQDDGAPAFASGETITGLTSGASCTSSGAPASLAPERVLEIQLYGVTRRTQVLREARYHLQRAQRTPLFASWGIGPGDLDVLPGDVVDVSADFATWAAKKFTIISTGYDADGIGLIEAREYDADVFADGLDTTNVDSVPIIPGGAVPEDTRAPDPPVPAGTPPSTSTGSSVTPPPASPPPATSAGTTGSSSAGSGFGSYASKPSSTTKTKTSAFGWYR